MHDTSAHPPRRPHQPPASYLLNHPLPVPTTHLGAEEFELLLIGLQDIVHRHQKQLGVHQTEAVDNLLTNKEASKNKNVLKNCKWIKEGEQVKTYVMIQHYKNHKIIYL